MKGNAFARSVAMMAAIAAAMSNSNVAMREAALAGIGPYKSRGKGKGKTSPSRHKVAMDRRGVQKPHEITSASYRSKYTPHFGAKQEAKLRRQREAAELKLAA